MHQDIHAKVWIWGKKLSGILHRISCFVWIYYLISYRNIRKPETWYQIFPFFNVDFLQPRVVHHRLLWWILCQEFLFNFKNPPNQVAKGWLFVKHFPLIQPFGLFISTDFSHKPMLSLQNKAFMAEWILSFPINQSWNFARKKGNLKSISILHYDIHFATIPTIATV